MVLTTDHGALPQGRGGTGRRAGKGVSYACILLLALAGLRLATGAGLAAVKLEPVEDNVLNSVLRQAFVLPMMANLPAPGGEGEKERVDAEIRKLRDLLHALGYLDAEIEVSGSPSEATGIRLLPVPGDLYRIGWISMVGLPEELSAEDLAVLEDFSAGFTGLRAGRDDLGKLEAGLVWRLRDAGYAEADIARVETRTNPELRMAGFTLTVSAGNAVRLGEIRFLGSKHTDILKPLAAFVVNEGDAYSASAMEKLHALLEETGLFSRIGISLAKTANDSGLTDLEIDLVERPPETNGIDFETGLGPALAIFTMLLILSRECTVGTKWSRRPFGPALSLAVAVFYVANIVIIFNLAVKTIITRG